jgi:hypothetical protein
MTRKAQYTLSYDEETAEQLRSIEAKHHSLIRKTIEEQLQFEPCKEIRNRASLCDSQRPLRQHGSSGLVQPIASVFFMESTKNAAKCKFRRSA